jgi:hypothetical protein
MRCKSLLTISLLVLGSTAVSAQATQYRVNPNDSVPISKRGNRIVPAGGDYALGFNVADFISAIDNGLDFEDAQQTIYGKRFLGSPTDAYNSLKAIRARITLNNQRSVIMNGVIDDTQAIPDTAILVTDKLVAKTTSVQLGAGYEWRRGYRRLYGIYGGEVVFNVSSQKNQYTYGNQMGQGNQTPTTTVNWTNLASAPVPASSRPTYEKLDPSFGVGINAIAGIEFFFATRSSVSVEFSLGFLYNDYFTSTREVETYSNNDGAPITVVGQQPAGKEVSLTTGIYQGALNLHFYF